MIKERIKNIFREMDDSDIVYIWNEYCQSANRYDDEILDAYIMVTFNGYGNIISFDYIYNSCSDEFYYIWIDELIEYITENKEAFGNDDIQEILDEESAED